MVLSRFVFSFDSFCLGLAIMELGKIYSALERHQDAVALKQKALEFHQRTLPADHPDIGAA